MTNYGPYVPGETFPVLDADRTHANCEYQRHVIVETGFIEPRISETDDWCTMPLRIVSDTAAGVHIEFGPYDLDPADIRALHNTIRAYYETASRGRLRVINDGGDR